VTTPKDDIQPGLDAYGHGIGANDPVARMREPATRRRG